MQKLLTFFSKNIWVYAIVNDKNFNDTLTNNIVNFEQLGPEIRKKKCLHTHLIKWHDYTQLAFYVNLHRAVIGPSATLTGR